MTTATVVGSGPNGLAAALTLAASGVRTRVLEAADHPGGGVTSAELTLPGLVHDRCAAFHPLGPFSSFAAEFDLAGAGLEWAWAPAELAHPLDGGRGATLCRSVTETAADLGADGPRWQRVFGPLAADFDRISQEFLAPVVHLPQHPLALARFGVRSALPAQALLRAWRGPEARALYSGVAAHAMSPFDAPFSAAIGVALTSAAHAGGWPVARGGSGRLLGALLTRLEEHGVTIETGRTVTDLRELDTDLVMLATSPAAAGRIMAARLPARRARAYRRFRPAPGVFKVDLAVQDGIPWRHEGSRHAGTVHVGGAAEEVAGAEKDVNRGRMPRRPFVLVGQQYLADPSRSRDGIHPVYAYAHVPHGYSGDATEVIVDRIEQFAPGFRERILARTSRSVGQAEAENANLVGGDVVGGANTARQLIARPRLSHNPYATGVPGVFLCSASTPPGAGAHGMCGYLAAQSALHAAARA